MATTGYNQDLIVEKSAVAQAGTGYTGAVTATMDSNSPQSGTTYYEIGADAAAPTTGLPTNNTPLVSADLSTTVFQLQPYTQSNALQLSQGQTGTLTLKVPTAFNSIAFLVSTGYFMAGTDALTLHFSDGTPNYTALTLSVPSWFNGTSPAYTSNGRVDVPSGNFFDVGSGNPRLYDSSFNLAAIGLAGHAISSIDFAYSGGGYASVFAVSGSVVPEPGTPLLILAFGTAAAFVARSRARQKSPL